MEVYIDVLVLQNIVMNYLILLMTAKLSKTKISNLRLLLGSLVGASYVVFLLMFPEVEVYYTTTAKIALSFFIVAVAFYPPKLKAFMRILAIFYISTFVFAGAAFAFLYFNNTGGLVQNGIFYIFDDSKWSTLFFSVVTVYIIVKIFWDLIQERLIRDNLCIPLKVAFENVIIDLFALVDTGNSLHDPLTNVPVVIVEFNAIRSILPIDIQNIFEESKEEDLISATKIISDSKWFSRFRLIPFTSLGKENGMLIGFKPDYIEIGENTDKKGVSDVIIGIYNRNLSNNNNYNALLSPELV